jgi:hypothetical protein
MTPAEVIDQFISDLDGIVSLHDGEVVDVFDAIEAASPTPQSRGKLLVALVIEEVRRRQPKGRDPR